MNCIDSFAIVLFLLGLLIGCSVGLTIGLCGNTLCYFLCTKISPRTRRFNLYGEEVAQPVLQVPCCKVEIQNN